MTREIVNLIEAADLPASVYRTARRLLDMAHPDNGYVRVPHEDMMGVCGTDSHATVRSHLVQLAAAGLITYRRNAAVHVHWHHWHHIADGSVIAQRSNRALSDQKVPLSDHGNLTDAEHVIAERSKSTAERSRRALSDQIDRSAITPRLTNTGSQEEGYPACLPAEGGAGETPPEPDEQASSLALLTDPEVGLDAKTAARLAAEYPFEEILRQVCRYQRDFAAGSVRSPMALRRRLRDRYAASITEADRASPLFRRHVPAGDDGDSDEAERRRKYIPDEFADIAIG